MLKFKITIGNGAGGFGYITGEVERIVEAIRIVQRLRGVLSPPYTVRATMKKVRVSDDVY